MSHAFLKFTSSFIIRNIRATIPETAPVLYHPPTTLWMEAYPQNPMISDKQLDANRRNAQLSTGPQTPEGRAAVRHNALTHGLTAQVIVLPDENKQEFEDLFASLEAEYQPSGPTESLLLKQIVINAWRIQRLQGMETSFFELAAVDHRKSFAEDYKNTDADDLHAYLFREDARIHDVLSRLARYESRIQRSFYKAMHELQRLQALRASPTSSTSNPETPPPSPPLDSSDATPDPTPPTSTPPTTNLTNQTHLRNRTPPIEPAETQQSTPDTVPVGQAFLPVHVPKERGADPVE